MKIAYIMQCHKCHEQINILAQTLSKNCHDIYLHIDKKSYIDSEIVINEHIKILDYKNRVDVRWGHISQVQATLHLIKEVLQSNEQYDYVCLISGQDFPVKSSIYIEDYLLKHNGAAFMDIMNVDTKMYKRFLKRNEVYTAQWMVNKSTFMRIVRNIWYAATGGRYKTLSIYKRKLGSDTFYFGSSWWCLPFQAVKEMYEYVNENPNYYNFFTHTLCPDESFFQTLLMNHTSYKDKVLPLLTYVNWGEGGYSPNVFTMNDYKKLKAIANNEGVLFARKFDMEKDSKIIQKVLNELC